MSDKKEKSDLPKNGRIDQTPKIVSSENHSENQITSPIVSSNENQNTSEKTETTQALASTENSNTQLQAAEPEIHASKKKLKIKKEGSLTFAKRAVSIMLEHPIYFAVSIIAMALIDSGILTSVLGAYNVQGSLLQQNAQLVPIILSFMGANLVKVLLFGPILSMIVVYLGFSFTQNKEASPYGAVNFILRNYGRLFIPFLIAQLLIQLGMIVVIPGVLFMMQYAFVDSVVCIERHKQPISRSRALTRALRKSLLSFIIPWAVISQVSGLVILQFSDNFASLTALNVITQTFYTFILCSFFCAYEFRSYQRSVSVAHKENKTPPYRPLVDRKTSSALGWVTFFALGSACTVAISTSLQKQSYASCVTTTVQTAFGNAPTTSSTFEAKSICESAKKTCSDKPPCEISCNITKYNIIHPKDSSKPYTMKGGPNITQCGK